jgi:flagellar biosynthesis/type III secretory pathway ATPase
MSEKLSWAKKGKESQGKRELIKHLAGQKITQKQAIMAKCYDCMGYYLDGKVDCEDTDCSLYPFMPYNPNRRKSIERGLKS